MLKQNATLIITVTTAVGATVTATVTVTVIPITMIRSLIATIQQSALNQTNAY